MVEIRRYRLGLLLVTASAIAWSTAGYFTRLIPLDTASTLFWRGLFGALGMLLFVCVYEPRRNFKALGSLGIAGWSFAALGAFGMLCFVAALKHTSVAHVSIVYATVPLLAAGLAWLVMREHVSASAMVASITALAGVMVMVGLGHEGSLAGDLLAFAMTGSMAVAMVLARRYQNIPMLAISFLSAALSAIVVMPFAELAIPDRTPLFHLALFGLTNSALGLALFSIGAKMLPAAETALIGALDAPLAPVWVMLAFGEVPSQATTIGGGIVFAAIFAHMVWGTRAKTQH